MSANAATGNSVILDRGGLSAHSGKVASADGTKIAYTRVGQGPALILVDPALCHRRLGPMAKLARALAASFTVHTYDRRGRGESGDVGPYAVAREVEDLEAMIAHAGGSAFVFGASSGGALALEAVRHGAPIEKLAVYEVPFIVDGTHAPQPERWAEELERLIVEERRGDAVTEFMRFIGAPAALAALMRLTPMWPKLKAVAHTLPYDVSIVAEHQQGVGFVGGEWDAVEVATALLMGGKSPAWMQNAMNALAAALPDGRRVTLAGQTHMIKAKVVGRALSEFFLGCR